MSFITECLKSCLCCFQSNRQLPIYDYDEIDDLEFENLLARPGTSPFSQQQPRNSIWNDLAALFRFKSKNSKNSYQSVPTYDQQDLLFDQDQQTDAELLTPEQISMMTSANMPPQEILFTPPSPENIPQPSTVMMSVDENFFSATRNITQPENFSRSLVDPLNVKGLGQSLQTNSDIVGNKSTFSDQLPLEEEETFDPALLATLTKKSFT